MLYDYNVIIPVGQYDFIGNNASLLLWTEMFLVCVIVLDVFVMDVSLSFGIGSKYVNFGRCNMMKLGVNASLLLWTEFF